MKKNILKESAQETVANCSANDLKRILGGEPTRNEEGELDYFTENSINPELRKAHPDLFHDIKYLRIFPKADKRSYYDQQGQGDPDDNKWAWQIYVTTLNDTTSDNTRAVVRIKDFIEGSIRNQINEVKKLQKLAGIKEASLPGGMMPTSGDNADLSVNLNNPSVADMADDFQGDMNAFARYIQTALQDAGIEAQAQVKFKPLRVDIKLVDPSQRDAAVDALNAEGVQVDF